MLGKWLSRWRYGDEIVVVSGLPRSGTSMLMKMLEEGGLSVMTDRARAADEDNPKGYFELERVKNLEHETDKAWLRDARGKVLKVISHLLKELPDDNFYRVLLVRRDLEEILASQNTMLQRRDERNPVDDAKAMDLYRKHLINVKVFLRRKPNFDLLEVSYRRALDSPVECARDINRYLGGGLDVQKMAATVDRSLYRNRRASPHAGAADHPTRTLT